MRDITLKVDSSGMLYDRNSVYLTTITLPCAEVEPQADNGILIKLAKQGYTAEQLIEMKEAGLL